MSHDKQTSRAERVGRTALEIEVRMLWIRFEGVALIVVLAVASGVGVLVQARSMDEGGGAVIVPPASRPLP